MERGDFRLSGGENRTSRFPTKSNPGRSASGRGFPRQKTTLRKKVEIIDAFVDARSGILADENGKIVRKWAKKC